MPLFRMGLQPAGPLDTYLQELFVTNRLQFRRHGPNHAQAKRFCGKRDHREWTNA